jgi:hypothetical protein
MKAQVGGGDKIPRTTDGENSIPKSFSWAVSLGSLPAFRTGPVPVCGRPFPGHMWHCLPGQRQFLWAQAWGTLPDRAQTELLPPATASSLPEL